jgi:murein DD-endopeptidase MepM/ murein hydrolase activator NlpD
VRQDFRSVHQRSQHQARHSHHPPRASRGRGGAIAALATIVLLASWAGTATLFILFRDDALKLIAEHQVSMSRAHQEQVAALEAEVERLKSVKLLDQERVERSIADLARRQTAIETRQSALAGIGVIKLRDDGPEITGSVAPAVPGSAPRPTPLSDTIMVAPPTERFSRLESRPLPPLASLPDASKAASASEVRIMNLSRDLARLEAAQSLALNEAEERFDSRERRMKKVFADLGMRGPHAFRVALANGAGGPFLAWPRSAKDPFTQQVERIRAAALSVETLEQEIASVPVRRPMLTDLDVTSGFGYRLDPFLRQPAMHTGVDFRGDPGDPVRATAGGKVVTAERNGGYGLMVEIDHGNGLTTRYAHLSAINVTAGMSVEAGAVVGRVGSTGRSTGPHLHYEVRHNGEATDPQRFLRAGLRLEDL